MKKFLLIIIIFTSFLSLFFSCDDSTGPPNNNINAQINLTLEDVSCTEVWLTLKSTNIQIPNDIVLKQNDEVRMTITLMTADTLLYIDSLLPNQSYKFQTINQANISSNELNVKTMDTTSHNFTFETFTFGGQAGSSALYDVAIIDENNIWAVGEIYLLDSLGNPDPASYNGLHWDGRRWELIKIGGYGGWACHTVFAFSNSDIWFEGNIHWDGSKYTAYMNGWPLMPNGDGWQVNKMWGTSSNDLYAVGNNGNIAHYDGRSWQRIESGTTTNINDIWGYYNALSNEETVLCVASNILHQGEYRLLSLSGNSAHDTLNWVYNDYWLKTIWFKNKYSPVYIGGGGIKVFKLNQWEEQDITNNFIQCIRGSDINDIFASGDNGFLGHFNGIQWHIYNELYSETVLLRLAAKVNTVVIVGYTFSGLLVGQAIVVIGRRIP